MAKRMIYKDDAGKRVPSVTTIIGRFKESGGLIYWANQQGLDGVTLQEARNQPARAGTLAHDLAEAHINGWDEPEAVALASEDIRTAARKAFDNFRNWLDQSRLEFKYTEVSLVSNLHRFGGRLDAIGFDTRERLCIIDFKTGAIYGEHLHQVAAYKLMWDENYPDDPLTGGAHLISFKRETGDFSHHYFDDIDAEAETFVKMRQLYDAVKRTEKRVK